MLLHLKKTFKPYHMEPSSMNTYLNWHIKLNVFPPITYAEPHLKMDVLFKVRTKP